jgi:hypothetical protein
VCRRWKLLWSGHSFCSNWESLGNWILFEFYLNASMFGDYTVVLLCFHYHFPIHASLRIWNRVPLWELRDAVLFKILPKFLLTPSGSLSFHTSTPMWYLFCWTSPHFLYSSFKIRLNFSIYSVFFQAFNCLQVFPPEPYVSSSQFLGVMQHRSWAGIAQSVWRLAMGWAVRGSNPGGRDMFRTRPDRPWSPPSLLYRAYQVFPGGKAAEAYR